MAKNKKNSVSTILLRVAAIILLLVGIALIFNKQISDQLIHHNQQSTLSGINRTTIEENKKKKGMYDFSKVKSLGIAQAARSQVKKTSGAIGALAIPDVNMYLPIMLGMIVKLTKPLRSLHKPKKATTASSQ